MKNNTRIIVIALVAALAGLALGYVFFGGSQQASDHASATGQTTAAAEEEATIWTCSMHPQIRQPEPGKCPICGMDLIPLSEMDSGGGDDSAIRLQMTPEAVKLAQVQTQRVQAANQSAATKTIWLNGKIKADETRVAAQAAHVPGRIEKLYVSYTGESVRKGQKLADIYSPELITAQRELLEALDLEAINPALVEAARNKLRYWKIPQADIEAIEQSRQIKEIFTVLADASGIVKQRRVAVGDYVRQGEVLFDMVNLDRVWVLFDAYEEDLADIRVGDRVRFTTPVFPDRTFQATITFIDPVIDPAKRTASLRAEVPNVGGLLKPEMLVKGQVEARARVAATEVLVPRTAVMWTGPRSVVYVKVPDASVPTFEYREVVLADRVGEHYVVKSGLAPGEEVVVNGNFAIDAAAQLNNSWSMMNKLVSAGGAALPDFAGTVPEAFLDQLGGLLPMYFEIKDGLVNDNDAAAIVGARGFLEALEKVDMMLLEGEAHNYWMRQMKAMQAHAEAIANSADLSEQRKNFGSLSELLIETLAAFGYSGQGVVVQHCPMAFDDAGADWLSNEQRVLNPYFGSAMLTCGTVEGDVLTWKRKKMSEVAQPAAPAPGHHHH